MRKVFFKNSAGDKLCGFLDNPSGDNSKPIIIFCHGFSSSKDSDSYVFMVSKLRNRGISSLRFDFWGHGESEGKFENITITEGVDDVLCAIKYLKKLGYQRIGLCGTSFGDIASIIAASKTKDLYLLALRSPVSNYLDKEIETKSKKELDTWKKNGYRSYQSGDGRKLKLNYSFYEDFKNNNGYLVAPKIKTPTLIVHSDSDEIVPYSQSVKISKLIPNCKLYTIHGVDHRYSDPVKKEKALLTIADFIADNSK